MIPFYVFGLYRSGTNFMGQLLSQNSTSVSVLKGESNIWKHAYDIENRRLFDGDDKKQTPKERLSELGIKNNVIYIHKHPYSWIESVIRKPVDIRKEYPCVAGGGDNNFVLNNLNIIELAKLNHNHAEYWFNLMTTKNIHRVQYEKIISSTKNTKQIVKNIFEKFDIPLTRNVIVPSRVPVSETFNEQSRKRYTNLYLEILTWEHIQRINSILDHNIIEQQGYQLITSENKYNKHKIR